MFSLIQGIIIGLLGTSATFSPLVADTSMWFTRKRGIALAICMSGNYLAGAQRNRREASHCLNEESPP